MRILKDPLFYMIGALILCAALGAYAYTSYRPAETEKVTEFKTKEEADVAVRFVMEGYDLIQANHWKGAPDTDLSQLFLLSVNKAANVSETLPATTRAGVATMLAHGFDGKDVATKKKLAVDTITVALFNLAPAGRAQLLTSQAQSDLNNTVTNVNAGKNLYTVLNLPNGAPPENVEKAFVEKKAVLEATTSATKAKDLEDLAYAHQVLTDTAQKNVYDTTKVEPTVFSHKENAKTLYVYISKMSPTTQSEFERAVSVAESDRAISSLILDLRGNVGGDLTFSQTFLGLFLGPNQFAFDMYVHGDYLAQRTAGLSKMAGLARVREMAVLTDGMSQSTAEVIAAAVKRNHLGKVVGTPTRGWGSVEKVFQIQTQLDPAQTYGILMVVALTVRDDAQPIEGNGVLPDASTADKDWKSKLGENFFSPDIIAAIKNTVTNPPQK